MDLAIQVNDDVVFCNCKWSEANGLASDAWGCYMELGKHLRELKEGKHKGKFKQWCAQELDFTYEWANKLIKAYQRYELSGFTDAPPASIEVYAEVKSTSLSNGKGKSEFEKRMDNGGMSLADLLTFEEPLSKREQMIEDWIKKNPGQYDDIDRFVLSRAIPMLRAVAKRYGSQGILQAREVFPQIKSADL